MRARRRLAVVLGSACLFLATASGIGGCGGGPAPGEPGTQLPTVEEKSKLEAAGKRAASEK